MQLFCLSLSSRNGETLYKWKALLNGPPSSHPQIWDSPLLSPTFCAAEYSVTVGCSMTAYPPCPHRAQRPLELLNSHLLTWIIGHISTYPPLCLCVWMSSAHTCVCTHIVTHACVCVSAFVCVSHISDVFAQMDIFTPFLLPPLHPNFTH